MGRAPHARRGGRRDPLAKGWPLAHRRHELRRRAHRDAAARGDREVREVAGDEKARSKMTFKLPNAEDRANVIAYLETLK